MSQAMDHLKDVMRRLRDPERGCPWDLKQNHKSLAQYLLEEAYEVVEVIEDSDGFHPPSDSNHLCEELGDVLLQIVFHAQIASENGDFDMDQVTQTVANKMVERHPHVFGDRFGVATSQDVLKNWEADKAKKRAAKAAENNKPHSLLDDVNTALPPLSRARKLQARAAHVGFDWTDPADIISKIREETDELEVEIQKGEKAGDEMEAELGDVLFVVVNLARKLRIDPARALRRTNRKFDRRFRGIENALAAQNRDITKASLEEMEALWDEMKAQEKAAK